MSLRDQLVKSGLVSQDKAKKVKREKGRRRHQAHRDREVREELTAEQRAREEAIAKADAEKREADRLKNREIQQRELRNQVRSEARQLIDKHRIEIPESADERFNFSSDGKRVRSVRVTSDISKRISDGELAICRNDRDGFDFPIVPKAIAERLIEIEAIEKGRWVYLLIDPNEVQESDAEDEWAAWDAYEASLKDEA